MTQNKSWCQVRAGYDIPLWKWLLFDRIREQGLGGRVRKQAEPALQQLIKY
jgi:hypothetical protein